MINTTQSLEKEIDAIERLVHPHLSYPDNSPDLSRHISVISPKQAILLKPSALKEPAVVAGLLLTNVIHIFMEDILEKKIALIQFFANSEKSQKSLELAKIIRKEDNFMKVKKYIDARTKYFN